MDMISSAGKNKRTDRVAPYTENADPILQEELLSPKLQRHEMGLSLKHRHWSAAEGAKNNTCSRDLDAVELPKMAGGGNVKGSAGVIKLRV